MTVIGAVAIGAVVVQLFATLVLQPARSSWWLALLDQIALVPGWKFFAFDAPGTNYRLLVRDGADDRPAGEWRTLFAVPPRRWRDAVFAPDRLVRGYVTVLMIVLVRRVQVTPGIGPADSDAYARLLRIAFAPGAGSSAPSRQFAIVDPTVAPAPRWLFVSPFHTA